MGVYKFRWNRPAQTVVVTGTFDDWTRSQALDRVGDGFEKAVRIDDAADKIHYKFVVDDAWTTDPSAPQETDSHGNLNNLLTPADIMADKATTPDAAAAALQNNVTPDSSTAQLAGNQPTTASSKKNKKKKKKAKAAGAGADESPAPEPADDKKPEDKPAEEAKPADEVSATPAPAKASEAEKEVKPEEKPEPEPEAKSEEQPEKSEPQPEDKPQDKAEETPAKPADKEAAATPTGVPGGFPNTPALAAEQEREASVSPLPAANGAVNPVKLEPGEEVPKATTEDVNKNIKLDEASYEKSDALPEGDKDKPVSVDPLPAAGGAVNPVKLEPGQEVPKATAEEVNKNVKLDKESYEKSDALPPSDKLPPTSANTIPESSLPVTGAAEAALLNSAGPDSSTAKLAGQVPLEPKAGEKPAEAVPEPVKGSIAESGKAPEAAAVEEKVEEKKQVEEEVKESVETKPAVAEATAAETKPEAKEEAKPAETKAAAAESKKEEAKPAEKKAEPKEEAKPAESKPAEKKEEAPKAAEPKKDESKPAEGAATNGAKEEPAKKKKNRLSSMFTKLKNKFSE